MLKLIAKVEHEGQVTSLKRNGNATQKTKNNEKRRRRWDSTYLDT